MGDPLSVGGSLVALCTAAQIACRYSHTFYEIASKAGAERICDDIELFASHISLFGSALKSSHALIRDHYDKYNDSSTLEHLEKDDILRKLAKQSNLLSKRLKTLKPRLKEENVGLGFMGRFVWVVVKASTREQICVWMERVKTNFLLIQYEVMYEALKKRFEDPTNIPNRSLFRDMQSELKDVQRQIKLQTKSMRVMSEKYEELTRGTIYEPHNDELSDIETFVSDIGDSMVSEAPETTSISSSSRRSTRSRRPSSSTKVSSSSSRTSTSHQTSSRTVPPSRNPSPPRNSQHSINSISQIHPTLHTLATEESSSHNSPPSNASETPNLRNRRPEQCLSYNTSNPNISIPAERSTSEDTRESIQGTQHVHAPCIVPNDINPNLPSGSTLPAFGERNLSDLSVISKAAIGHSQDEEPPGWNDRDFMAVRIAADSLHLNPALNSRKTTGQINPKNSSPEKLITAMVNAEFSVNMISRQLAEELKLEIEPCGNEDEVPEVKIGNDGNWKEVVTGEVHFVWKTRTEPHILMTSKCLVCDFEDCESVPFPLVFGRPFLEKRKHYRRQNTNTVQNET